MTEDTSLSDFGAGGSDEADDGDRASDSVDDAGGDAAQEAGSDAPADLDADASPDPAVATSAYAPEGAACESCGTPVQRRYRAEAGLVCAECKPW